MFAVVETGGKQYKVAPGQNLDIERLDVEPGQQFDLGRVLMVSGDNGQVTVGTPTVAGARVLATLLVEHRGDKLIIFKFKAKKGYRRKNGHRQSLSRVSIDQIIFGDNDNEQARPQTVMTVPVSEQLPVTVVELPVSELPTDQVEVESEN